MNVWHWDLQLGLGTSRDDSTFMISCCKCQLVGTFLHIRFEHTFTSSVYLFMESWLPDAMYWLPWSSSITSLSWSFATFYSEWYLNITMYFISTLVNFHSWLSTVQTTEYNHRYLTPSIQPFFQSIKINSFPLPVLDNYMVGTGQMQIHWNYLYTFNSSRGKPICRI